MSRTILLSILVALFFSATLNVQKISPQPVIPGQCVYKYNPVRQDGDKSVTWRIFIYYSYYTLKKAYQVYAYKFKFRKIISSSLTWGYNNRRSTPTLFSPTHSHTHTFSSSIV